MVTAGHIPTSHNLGARCPRTSLSPNIPLVAVVPDNEISRPFPVDSHQSHNPYCFLSFGECSYENRPLSVAARAQILEAYTHIFQTIRAPVTKTRSTDTSRHAYYLVRLRPICRSPCCVFGGPIHISGLFRNLSGLNLRLSDFPTPPVVQVSRPIRRQTVQTVDGTSPAFVGVICADSRQTQVFISSTGKQHEYFASLHEEYGDIVRTGEPFPS